jgi:hypothetical protein
MEEAGISPASLLSMHVNGDWGDLDEHDRKESEFSLKNGLRILSSYTLSNGEKIWVITEADRSSTCSCAANFLAMDSLRAESGPANRMCGGGTPRER